MRRSPSIANLVGRLKRVLDNHAYLHHHLTNVGHLLSGNLATSVLTLVSTAIAARALGVQEFGLMAILFSYTRLVERIVRFESWQPLIKFAAEAITSESKLRLSRLYLYGLLLDIFAAIVAASLAFLVAIAFGNLFNLAPDDFVMIGICSVAILFNITGMPTASLRMAGRFRTIAYCQVFAQILRLLGAAYCWWANLGLAAFLIAWVGSQSLGAILFLILGFRALKDQGIGNPLRQSPRGLTKDYPNFLSFAWSTNLSMTLRTLTQEADTLLVGAMVGQSAAGLYNIAKRMGNIVFQIGSQVQAVIYPELAVLWAKADTALFRRTILQLQAILACVGGVFLLGVWIFGKLFITLALGVQYQEAYPLLLTQMLAVILMMHMTPARAALLAMGRPQMVLLISAIGAAVFFAVAFVAVPLYGAGGANIAQIALAAISATLIDFTWFRGLAKKSNSIAEKASDISQPPHSD